jgi:Tol biopolymer transport system component
MNPRILRWVVFTVCLMLVGIANNRDVRAQSTSTRIEWQIADNQFLVYLRDATGERRFVFRENSLVMNSELIRLAPNGKQIAFVTAADLGMRDAAVWLINSDGSGRRKILGSEPGFWVTNPVWSPDSMQIAYTKISQTATGQVLGLRLAVFDSATGKSRDVVTDSGFDPILLQ